jgi:hypothetical protein
VAVHCAVHQFDTAKDICERCGDSLCERCSVYPKGEHKPAVCRECLLAIAGVRKAPRPALSKREFRRRRRELMDLLEQRPASLAEALGGKDLRWLDEVEYAADAQSRARAVIDWKI